MQCYQVHTLGRPAAKGPREVDPWRSSGPPLLLRHGTVVWPRGLWHQRRRIRPRPRQQAEVQPLAWDTSNWLGAQRDACTGKFARACWITHMLAVMALTTVCAFTAYQPTPHILSDTPSWQRLRPVLQDFFASDMDLPASPHQIGSASVLWSRPAVGRGGRLVLVRQWIHGRQMRVRRPRMDHWPAARARAKEPCASQPDGRC